MDIAGFTLSDLEDDDEEYFEKFEILCNCFECTSTKEYSSHHPSASSF